MPILIPGIFTEIQLYLMYDLFKQKESELENKAELSEREEVELANCKAHMQQILDYSAGIRAQGLKWSLTSLFQDSGMNPTLILHFYPGSDAYNTYGKQAVVNIEYSADDLQQIFVSMRDKLPRVAGQLKVKIVPSFVDAEINTADIFSIQ